MKLLGPVVFFLVLGSALAYKSYSGYQVLETAPLTPNVMPYINKMSRKYDFWGTPILGRSATVMVSPEEAPLVSAAFNRLRLPHEIKVEDLAPLIEKERSEQEALRKAITRQPRAAVYDRFMTHDEIDAFVHEVVDANPGVASLLDLGLSFEGRDLHGVSITSGTPGKPAVWFDCNIHAREWITAPVCMRIIEEVIADPALRDLIDWHVIPVANPDGYDYTFTDDRLWRKTRQPNAGSTCVGTDPNRNYDFLWNLDNDEYTCGATYPGPTAFSEPETKAMSDFITANADNLVLYVAVHSKGELILYPFGHTIEPVPNRDQLQAAGEASAAAIEAVFGTQYTVDNSAAGLYFTYGASDDWAYGSNAVSYSYTYEMPGGGSFGWDIPPTEIQRVVDETWPGMKALIDYVLANP